MPPPVICEARGHLDPFVYNILKFLYDLLLYHLFGFKNHVLLIFLKNNLSSTCSKRYVSDFEVVKKKNLC